MPRIDSYEMLFEEIGHDNIDYKVSLDAQDEATGMADYLWNKISVRNKIGISSELDSNKNLVPCELKNNRIVLSPNESSSTSDETIILLESYSIIESTTTISLPGPNTSTVTYTCFPFQFASGRLRTIQIQQAQASGSSLSQVNVAVYANDVPGITGSWLLWGSTGTCSFDSSGNCIFKDATTGTYNGPVIPGYSTVNGVRRANTFMYVMFAALGNSDGGYKLLGYRNGTLDGLLRVNSMVDGLSTYIVSNIQKTEEFHSFFDYSVESTTSGVTVPYIAMEMII